MSPCTESAMWLLIRHRLVVGHIESYGGVCIGLCFFLWFAAWLCMVVAAKGVCS